MRGYFEVDFGGLLKDAVGCADVAVGAVEVGREDFG